jgi:bacterioferritin (cytochrome b1)
MAWVLTSLLRGSAMIRIRPEVSNSLKAGDAGAVTTALQVALELEFATIPPYLYAMWSLGSSLANSAVAEIIKSVIHDEMRHLAMVANLINALGGTPVLASPDHIPRYPHELPGSVEHDLVVGLAPFSIDLVQNTFMVIEQPEQPLQFHVAAALAADEPQTIGQFYRTILETITNLPDGAFSGSPDNQVALDGVVTVTDVTTAKLAINTIIDQGEGTDKSPVESAGTGINLPGTDFAHYYRFAEIARGLKLKPNPDAGPSTPPDQQFVFGPDVIPAPTGVLAAPSNPTAAGYPEGSAARTACDDFNATYTSMLKMLQTVFTGQPDQLGGAVRAMFSLQTKATRMMAATPPTGPSFEWRDVST